MFASDIHGDAECAGRMLEAFENEGAERLILLGDLLYHGPRNDLPAGYDPKATIALLNRASERILAVKGNCDGEVDGMVLSFPIAAEYAWLYLGGKACYITHGHHISEENTENLSAGSILVTGHTHLCANRETEGGIRYVNPGSVSIPKGGNPRTYMIYEPSERKFRIKTFDGTVLDEYKIG